MNNKTWLTPDLRTKWRGDTGESTYYKDGQLSLSLPLPTHSPLPCSLVHDRAAGLWCNFWVVMSLTYTGWASP